jgi:hypothetical protein
MSDRKGTVLLCRPVPVTNSPIPATTRLIAYEGRSAYERAREQAEYCLRRGSEAGCRFWSDVALEVARSSILRRGDLALYAAKEEGRNRTKIDPKGTR